MTTYSRKRRICLASAPLQLPSPPPSDPSEPADDASTPPQSTPPSTTITTCTIPLKPITAQSLSTTPQPPPTKKRKRPLIQTRIDLGGPAHRRCPACGMEYTPSCAEDAALHKRFHAAALGGLAVPSRALAECKMQVRRPRVGGGAGGGSAVDTIVRVCRGDGRAARGWAERMLAFVEGELGAVGTEREVLWGRGTGEADKENVAGGLKGDAKEGGERYRVFLYVHGGKCVGLALFERIARARRVLPRGEAEETARASLMVGEEWVEARMGVSRIWVSKEMRRVGVARALLDVGADVGLESARRVDEVAFSQPTESGARLARRWFGREDGWLVY